MANMEKALVDHEVDADNEAEKLKVEEERVQAEAKAQANAELDAENRAAELKSEEGLRQG